MRGRTLILIGLALVAGLLAWWAVGERRPVEDQAVAREADGEPAGDERDVGSVAGASETVEREGVEEASPIELVVTHRFIGRVVDERRHPVAGARVELSSPDLAEHATTTDADGRFSFELALGDVRSGPHATIRARDGEGHGGGTTAWIAASRPGGAVVERDLGAIVLIETHALRVFVGDGDGPVARAAVRARIGHERQPFEERATDEFGEVLFEELEPGPVYLTARAPGRAKSACVFVPEQGEARIALEPVGAATVTVVDKGTGAPVEGAEVRWGEFYRRPADTGRRHAPYSRQTTVIGLPTKPGVLTDAEGRARIDGLAMGEVRSLTVQARGYDDLSAGNGPLVRHGAEPVRVELEPVRVRTVRWPIIAGELDVPDQGTPLVLRWTPGSSLFGEEPELPGPARVEGAQVVVDQVAGQASLIAETPEGSLAKLWVDEDSEVGRELSFRRPRRVEVLLRDEHGSPAVGVMTSVHGNGNHALCPDISTDADGRALFTGLYGGRAEVQVASPGAQVLWSTVGAVDLEAGDGRVEATLAQGALWRVRLRLLIDGAPRLPAHFRVYGLPTARVAEEHPAHGELSLELEGAQPGASVSVGVHAPGFRVGSVDFVLPEDGREAQVELALERAGSLVAHVSLPDEGSVVLSPQLLDEDSGAWGTPPELGYSSGLSWPNGPDDSFVFEGLSPGRWRVIDGYSKLASDEAVFAGGEGELHVALDLASFEWVSGRVELDDPAELARVRVQVLEMGREARGEPARWRRPVEGARLDGDAFRVRVPAGRESELVAWHPWLVSPEGVGRATVVGGRDGVVLKLEAGDELRLPAPALVGAWREPTVWVGRYAGEPVGEPLGWHSAVLVDGVLRCGLPRGRWTLWIDTERALAPLVRRGVEVEGATELPPADFVAGSSVRLRVRVPEGQAWPSVSLRALRLGTPEYRRYHSERDGDELVLAGLGAGRFRISASARGVRQGLVEREVELDGVNDLDLELDLR